MAATLAYLFPSDAKSVEALAGEAAMRRMWAGIHFHSDDDAGLELGRRVKSSVIQRAQNDGAAVTMPFPAGHSVGRQADGTYQWAFDGKVFTINAIADKCDTRRTVNTSGPWFLQQ